MIKRWRKKRKGPKSSEDADSQPLSPGERVRVRARTIADKGLICRIESNDPTLETKSWSVDGKVSRPSPRPSPPRRGRIHSCVFGMWRRWVFVDSCENRGSGRGDSDFKPSKAANSHPLSPGERARV